MNQSISLMSNRAVATGKAPSRKFDLKSWTALGNDREHRRCRPVATRLFMVRNRHTIEAKNAQILVEK